MSNFHFISAQQCVPCIASVPSQPQFELARAVYFTTPATNFPLCRKTAQPHYQINCVLHWTTTRRPQKPRQPAVEPWNTVCDMLWCTIQSMPFLHLGQGAAWLRDRLTRKYRFFSFVVGICTSAASADSGAAILEAVASAVPTSSSSRSWRRDGVGD